jgi:hypothetical protein
MLAARGKPLALHLGDYSAVVTAWLLAVALPPLAPWWLTVIGRWLRHRGRQASLRWLWAITRSIRP